MLRECYLLQVTNAAARLRASLQLEQRLAVREKRREEASRNTLDAQRTPACNMHEAIGVSPKETETQQQLASSSHPSPAGMDSGRRLQTDSCDTLADCSTQAQRPLTPIGASTSRPHQALSRRQWGPRVDAPMTGESQMVRDCSTQYADAISAKKVCSTSRKRSKG